ncbi:sugar phosphate nucleotidyltransferase [Desulfobotulus alkaliphilus]|nr:NTP transferase domain-containing protein [Desulfobotulus alkaliphilus]
MEDFRGLAVVILAAGKGTRMRSDLAKVLHPVGGVPMIVRVAESVQALEPEKCIVVVGHQADAVTSLLRDYSFSFALQKKQLGTGHAVASAMPFIPPDCQQVLVLCGDTPLIRTQTLERLCRHHSEEQAALTLLAVHLEDPHGYGRIVCDPEGRVQAIVEEKDASPEEKRIRHVNAGFYCFDRSFLAREIAGLDRDNSQGEYYLTDLLAVARGAGERVACVTADFPEEVMGINSPENLEVANLLMGKAAGLNQFP